MTFGLGSRNPDVSNGEYEGHHGYCGADSLYDITSVLSAPERRLQETTSISLGTRAANQAAIRYNSRHADLSRSARDVALRAAWEVQTAIKHPTQATRKLSGALAGAIIKSAEVGGSLAQESSRKGFELVKGGCHSLVRGARRAARSASMSISGVQQQDGGRKEYASDESFEEISSSEIEEGVGICSGKSGKIHVHVSSTDMT
ncbi:hypothetical protein DRE_00919 [Drechslerella stenobrocha 248]|uniref:Senescence domain-containing protein n=1 Tax=Drechslerella stenobrocha 248 TaxID=1043628 RepID=W7I7A6_9PEZI|nr:hypothetical protein DRE_00919 [Drechslerella stenobrocha 248]